MNLSASLPANTRAQRVCFALAAAITFTAHAAEPFDLSASATGAASPTILSKGSSLLGSVDSIVRATGPFSPLNGTLYDSTIAIGRAGAVLQISGNAAGTSVTIRDPNSSTTKTLTASSREELAQAVQDYLEKKFNAAFVGYQKALNNRTGVGITDGNPLASTAWMANDAFVHFGSRPVHSTAVTSESGEFVLGVDASAGTQRTDQFNNNYASVNLSGDLRFNDTVGLGLSIPLLYRELAGTDAYVGGLTVGAPITVIHSKPEPGAAWQVTPWVHIAGAIDEDLLAGGGTAGGGLTSSLACHTGNWVFTLANQIGYDAGFQFDYDGIRLDTPVDQWIVKNGVYADYSFENGIFIDGGVAYTNFLKQAGVSNYFTPTIGVGYRWGQSKASSVELSFVGDYGSGYQDQGGQVLARFKF